MTYPETQEIEQKIVLDTINLSAEYTIGDIGWEILEKRRKPAP
jgi:hypothetical protein